MIRLADNHPDLATPRAMAPARIRGLESRVLVGANAYNPHVQQMVRALSEVDALHLYLTSGVDCSRHAMVVRARRSIARVAPAIDRELRRRAAPDLSPQRVRTRWRWELPRVVLSRCGLLGLETWVWERSERALARHCASLLRRPAVAGFVGVEHGALEALRAAREVGKPGVLAVLSPHYRTMARWVDAEFARSPELRDARHVLADRLAPARNARKDQEAELADLIVTGSTFTTRSLIESGVNPSKIATVPLGGPDPLRPEQLPRRPPARLRLIHVGLAAVHKGTHYLLNAFSRIERPDIELHLYGGVLLPPHVIDRAKRSPGGESIVFHGSVPAGELREAYVQSSLLVMPTLADGFGQVIAEALAHGLPVLTTRNAGASDLIEPGVTGCVVDAADEDALVRALTWAAERPEELFAMRRQALVSAARRTWSHFRRDFVGALQPIFDRQLVS